MPLGKHSRSLRSPLLKDLLSGGIKRDNHLSLCQELSISRCWRRASPVQTGRANHWEAGPRWEGWGDEGGGAGVHSTSAQRARVSLPRARAWAPCPTLGECAAVGRAGIPDPGHGGPGVSASEIGVRTGDNGKGPGGWPPGQGPTGDLQGMKRVMNTGKAS